jgi:hypothetical protein
MSSEQRAAKPPGIAPFAFISCSPLARLGSGNPGCQARLVLRQAASADQCFLPRFPDAGKVGLWTKADSVTLFDEVTYGETGLWCAGNRFSPRFLSQAAVG